MEIKLVVGNPKDGVTQQIVVEDAKGLMGLKIGQTFKGEVIDKTGYVFKVTGGSDNAGFPMRKDVEGSRRQKILIAGGVGFKPTRKGVRVRKTVSGNTVGEITSQLNVVIEKVGPKPLVEAPVEEEKTE